MISKRIRFSLLPLLALVAGCIPILFLNEYVPEMAGGTIKMSNCLDAKRVEYASHGVVLRSSLGKGRNGHLSLSIGLSIPSGITATLEDPFVRVATPANAQAKKIDIAGFSTGGFPRPPIQPLKPMVGGETLHGTVKQPHFFSIWLSLDEAILDELSVVLPRLDINGEKVVIPNIIFRRNVKTHVMAPLNC